MKMSLNDASTKPNSLALGSLQSAGYGFNPLADERHRDSDFGFPAGSMQSSMAGSMQNSLALGSLESAHRYGDPLSEMRHRESGFEFAAGSMQSTSSDPLRNTSVEQSDAWQQPPRMMAKHEFSKISESHSHTNSAGTFFNSNPSNSSQIDSMETDYSLMESTQQTQIPPKCCSCVVL
eukprot:576125_1